MSDLNVKPMTVTALVEHALNAMKHDRLENRPGLRNMLKIMSPSRQIFSSSSSTSRSIGCLRRPGIRPHTRT
jgi:hypothetical protein